MEENCNALTETANGEVLYNIACISCRNAHRKCDRHYPVCHKCRDRNECKWPKIVKRRRKREEQEASLYEPNNHCNKNTSTTIVSTISTSNQLECVTLMHYIYYQNMLFLTPTFTPSELENLITSQFQNEPIINKGQQAALFALECYCLQRVGLSNECTSLFDACQYLINKIWFSDDNSHDIDYCIQAVSILGLYCLGHGFVNIAEKYAKMLKQHLQHQTPNTHLLFYIHLLEFSVELHRCLFVKENADLDVLLKLKLVRLFEKRMNLEVPCDSFSTFLFELEHNVDKLFENKTQIENMRLITSLLQHQTIRDVEMAQQKLPLFPYFVAKLVENCSEFKDVMKELRQRYLFVEQYCSNCELRLNG